MRASHCLGLSIGLTLLGCAGFGTPDPDQLAALDRHLAESPVEGASTRFALGAIDAGAVTGDCAAVLRSALSSSEADLSGPILAHALSDPWTRCPAMCLDDLDGVALNDPADRAAAAAMRCDAQGADPIFGGPLASLRPAMPALEYVVVRGLAEVTTAVHPSLAAHHAKLATSLALRGAPPEVPLTSTFEARSARAIDDAVYAPLRDAVRACEGRRKLAHRIVLDSTGRVVGATGPHQDCVDAAIQAFVAPAPADGAYTVIDLAWLPADEAPVAPAPKPAVVSQAAAPKPTDLAMNAPRPAPQPAGAPSIVGNLDREVIRRVVSSKRGAIASCYEQARVRDANRAGQATVAFAIAPSGSVTSATIDESTLGDPAMEACLKAVFLRMVFPAPNGVVVVRWPLVFSPG